MIIIELNISFKPEDIISQISPSKSALKIVTDFLESYGLLFLLNVKIIDLIGITGENARVSKYGDKVHVKMPIKVAESMLQTEFALFRSVVRRNVVIPRIIKPYFLPAEIANVVTLVDDILRFPSIRQNIQSFGSEETVTSSDPFSSCGAKCSGYTTPDVLQQAYGYPSLTAATKGNSMSVAEFQFQYCNHQI